MKTSLRLKILNCNVWGFHRLDLKILKECYGRHMGGWNYDIGKFESGFNMNILLNIKVLRSNLLNTLLEDQCKL